jgi:GT2 family glycosyltransferase
MIADRRPPLTDRRAGSTPEERLHRGAEAEIGAVTVVVATYDRAAMLRGALVSLARQETGDAPPPRILVVDNGSTDGTRGVVEDLSARSRTPITYCHEPAMGVARARNRGIREAATDWIAFFDDDQEADPGWLRELLSVAAQRGALCVGGRVELAMDAPPPSPLRPFCRALLGETFHGDAPRPFGGKELPGTGNVLVHRRLLEAVGAFDERFARGAEDADLFRRARRAGLALWYAPGARVRHRIPPYRLSEGHLAWVAARHGAGLAAIDHKQGGRGRVLGVASLRIAQALAFTAPSLLASASRGDRSARLEELCLLSRAAGYCRQALPLVAPRLFTERRLLGSLEFRAERARYRRA